MRLIDADALRIAIGLQYPMFHERIAIRPVFEAIKKAPTIEAVPVIQCKDCCYYAVGFPYNFCDRNRVQMMRGDNDYCSKAERKDDEA